MKTNGSIAKAKIKIVKAKIKIVKAISQQLLKAYGGSLVTHRP